MYLMEIKLQPTVTRKMKESVIILLYLDFSNIQVILFIFQFDILLLCLKISFLLALTGEFCIWMNVYMREKKRKRQKQRKEKEKFKRKEERRRKERGNRVEKGGQRKNW